MRGSEGERNAFICFFSFLLFTILQKSLRMLDKQEEKQPRQKKLLKGRIPISDKPKEISNYFFPFNIKQTLEYIKKLCYNFYRGHLGCLNYNPFLAPFFLRLLFFTLRKTNPLPEMSFSSLFSSLPAPQCVYISSSWPCSCWAGLWSTVIYI